MSLATVHIEIPSLKDVLPSGGIPGLTYAFIALGNLIRAQEDGYDMVRKPAFWVENTTTGDRVGVLLMAHGTINPGLSPSSGARRVMIDPMITELFEVDLAGASTAVAVEQAAARAVEEADVELVVAP